MKRAELFTKINHAFEVLGNPLRFRIYLKVLEEGCDCDFDDQRGVTKNCVSSIMKNLDMPQSTVSMYLKDLVNAGLVDCEKRGRFLYCRPNREMLIAIKSFIDSSISRIKFSGVKNARS